MVTASPTTAPLPVLRGDLSLRVGRGDNLFLELVIRCPGCGRQPHVHTWPGTVDDPPQPRAAHCHRRRSQFFAGTYLIVPRPTAANRRAVALLDELERHPRRRRLFARQLRAAQRREAEAEHADRHAFDEW